MLACSRQQQTSVKGAQVSISERLLLRSAQLRHWPYGQYCLLLRTDRCPYVARRPTRLPVDFQLRALSAARLKDVVTQIST